MNASSDIKTVVTRALGKLAPEADLTTLDGRADLREALDLDSMDFLGFIKQVHETLHVDVPERDYGKVRTLDDCVAYLTAKLSPQMPIR